MELSNLLTGKEKFVPGRTLAIDPGETTGWCVFDGLKLLIAGQIKEKNHEESKLAAVKLLWDYDPDVVIMENFFLYAWKAKDQIGSQFPTVEVLGVLKMKAYETNTPVHLQAAGLVKGFWSNDKLRQFGLYQTGKRHANDAIRHAAYFLVFGKWPL